MIVGDDIDILHSHPYPALASDIVEGSGQGPHEIGMLSGTISEDSKAGVP